VTTAHGGGPIIPDYSGPNVRGIIPALLGPTWWDAGIPSWFPAPVAEARKVVLLVIDGLGWDQFVEHRQLMPRLASLAGGPIHTVAPTTTATALSSIATGLTPAEHGLVGYRMALGREVLNVLRWTIDGQNARRVHPPRDLQPYDAFLGRSVPVVSQADLENSGFSEAHLYGCQRYGWRAASSIAVEASARVAAGERFVYCYYGGVDKIAHERGFGPFYEAELSFADHLVGALLDALPPDTCLLVTADHGQVEVGSRIIEPSPELLAGVVMQSGEGRFRWLHVSQGATSSVYDAALDGLADVAWVVTREQTLDEHWFGPSMAPRIRSRLGDVALVAREPVSFHDPDDAGPFALMCRHGSLTSAEVNVPLLAGTRLAGTRLRTESANVRSSG
jgi:hypothetical protein